MSILQSVVWSEFSVCLESHRTTFIWQVVAYLWLLSAIGSYFSFFTLAYIGMQIHPFFCQLNCLAFFSPTVHSFFFMFSLLLLKRAYKFSSKLPYGLVFWPETLYYFFLRYVCKSFRLFLKSCCFMAIWVFPKKFR